MQMWLFNMAQSIMGLAGNAKVASNNAGNSAFSSAWNTIVEPVLKVMDQLLWPIIILLGTAGSIYAIVLGVEFSKAESADKREEAKKRMINAVIGLVITLILLILLKLLTNNASLIASWINGIGGSRESFSLTN